MKKYFQLLNTLSLFMILTLCLLSKSYAVPIIGDYAQFADNINNGRFTLEDEELLIEGLFSSPIVAKIKEYKVVSETDSTITYEVTYWTSGTGTQTKTITHSKRIDPQEALLLSRFEIDGVNIIDDLIDEAMLPENVLLTQRLPDFLGGTTFTATSAFSGSVVDDDGHIIPDVEVGFGVFETDSNEKYFSPISFVDDILDLALIESISWDFSSVIPESFSGSFKTEGRLLLALDATPVPEPATILLIGTGLVGFAGGAIRKKLKK